MQYLCYPYAIETYLHLHIVCLVTEVITLVSLSRLQLKRFTFMYFFNKKQDFTIKKYYKMLLYCFPYYIGINK